MNRNFAAVRLYLMTVSVESIHTTCTNLGPRAEARAPTPHSLGFGSGGGVFFILLSPIGVLREKRKKIPLVLPAKHQHSNRGSKFSMEACFSSFVFPGYISCREGSKHRGFPRRSIDTVARFLWRRRVSRPVLSCCGRTHLVVMEVNTSCSPSEMTETG